MSDSVSYSKMVDALVKAGADIELSLTPGKCHLWHMVTGISGEAGELLDAAKKHIIYNKELDFDNVVEECGDIEFYLEGLRQYIGVSREYIIRKNSEKLAKRYGERYSDQAAQDRADKVEKVK
ncbi:nucleoside triphosphate pyrophosphohydrolase family protein [Ferrovum sp.]|uniref:nucleoside triphosphate pyrophosphohydrolase family protein n=1 Tax=Ferrovum sp. TaxID=2609467 RepID=UPI0026257999|nr:nucleoside triphosphate pyrophosphohydrolase family protein [Ferrovum sp.]